MARYNIVAGPNEIGLLLSLFGREQIYFKGEGPATFHATVHIRGLKRVGNTGTLWQFWAFPSDRIPDGISDTDTVLITGVYNTKTRSGAFQTPTYIEPPETPA